MLQVTDGRLGGNSLKACTTVIDGSYVLQEEEEEEEEVVTSEHIKGSSRGNQRLH